MVYKIAKVNADHVVDFAAEELKKYLRMMMPRCGEIAIEYAPGSQDGFRLGLMSDFGLDTSEAKDLTLDDILHIDTTGQGGVIAGSNPRSVLLAVYRYLYENGCRWLYPGVDGEYIPVKNIVDVKYHKMADNRYRGWCNEGAEYQQNMLETIDFAPKVGMSVYMLEFDNPICYYDTYYNHKFNTANRDPEPVTEDTVLQWKRQCEAEISKRGLQFHDMGHGWTMEPFGVDTSSRGKKSDDVIPPESADYAAMIDGKRGLFKGAPINTQFCMSNSAARAKVVKYISDYAELYTNVDYLHVWLADGYNNHCECDVCKSKTPSDWYVVLLNEIDAELTSRKLATRIVFICYTDTTWVAQLDTIKSMDRFSFMLAAISRDYTQSVSYPLKQHELMPFVLNKNVLPKTVDEYIAHANEWKKIADCPRFVYEYHFWFPQYFDLGAMSFAKITHEDVKGYRNNGFEGIIQDGSQRSFFPNGFVFYTYCQTLFDSSLTFEQIKEDYFKHAYGENWKDIAAYFEKIGQLFSSEYLHGLYSANKEIGKYYNPKYAQELRKVPSVTEELLKQDIHLNRPYRVQTVSYKLLQRHVEYCNALANALALKACGADEEALAAYTKFVDEFGKYEVEIERYYDHALAYYAFRRVFFEHNSTF